MLKAQEKYQVTNTAPVRVNVYFSPAKGKKQDKRQLIDALLDAVIRNRNRANPAVGVNVASGHDSAVLIHYRNRLGFAVISFKNYKQPALKNEPDYLHPANAESYGSNGVLMVPSNNSTAAAGDTQYEVVSISDPASPKPLATIPAVIQRLDREQTGTIFLLTDSGLTVVRCLAAEREHQIEAQQKNEN